MVGGPGPRTKEERRREELSDGRLFSVGLFSVLC